MLAFWNSLLPSDKGVVIYLLVALIHGWQVAQAHMTYNFSKDFDLNAASSFRVSAAVWSYLIIGLAVGLVWPIGLFWSVGKTLESNLTKLWRKTPWDRRMGW